jgi:hypothetical protein
MTNTNIINQKAEVRRTFIGSEQTPILIIDEFCLDPDHLVDQVSNHEFEAPKRTVYPGLNAPLPPDYAKTLCRALLASISRTYGYDSNRGVIISGFAGLTSLDFSLFSPDQKLPHYDETINEQWAFLHYLGKGDFGGTGFFRHDSTGFERITATRAMHYNEIAAKELQENPPTSLCGPNTIGYTCIKEIEFVYNRLIIYPSNLLHCALYQGNETDSNPKTGRLSFNIFVRSQ